MLPLCLCLMCRGSRQFKRTFSDIPLFIFIGDKHGACRQWYRVRTPVNTKHLYSICTKSDQRRRRWADVVQMLCECFVFAGTSICSVYPVVGTQNQAASRYTCMRRHLYLFCDTLHLRIYTRWPPSSP